jgi:hypothetical protein
MLLATPAIVVVTGNKLLPVSLFETVIAGVMELMKIRNKA